MVHTKATPRHADIRSPKCIISITRNPVTFVIYFYWINKRETGNKKWLIRGMSTSRPRNLHPPLCPRTLLITDVTRLQPFIARGDSFQENIETLVSYNVCSDSFQQDCLYIEQGHLMTPTMFMTYSMVIDHEKV